MTTMARRVGLALLLALGAGGVFAWWAGRPTRALAEAERLLNAGEWDRALAALAVPEASAATRDRARILRARVAIAAGRPNEAVAPLQAVADDAPDGAEATFWKGRALQAVGNTPMAVAWYRRALERRPKDAETLRWLAAAAYDLGDRTTVLQALETLTAVDRRDARAWRTLGLVTLEEPEGGELEQERARVAFETSLKVDPAQPRVRLDLARVLVKQGRFDDARRELERCRGLVPEGDRADLLAQVAWGRGDRAACREAVDAGLKASANHPGLLARRGLLARAEGHAEVALAWLDRAVAADPFESQWVFMRGTTLRSLGRNEEAERDARRAEELKKAVVVMAALNAEAAERPNDPEVRIRIGRHCETLGKNELAASWYRAALAIDPRSEAARAALEALRAGEPSILGVRP